MKRLIIALAIGVVAASATHGLAGVDNTLQATANWGNDATWDGAGHPDMEDDRALCDNGTGPYTVYVNSDFTFGDLVATWPCTIQHQTDGADNDLTLVGTGDWNGLFYVNAASRAVTVTQQGESDGDNGIITAVDLTIQAGDTVDYHAVYQQDECRLTVSGTTTIDASAAANADATFQLNGDTFDPGDLYIDGGDPSESDGQALFDQNVSTTLTDPDLMTMRGDSKFDAVGLAGDLTWGSVVVTAEATTNNYETVAEIAMQDATPDKMLKVGKLYVTGGTHAGDTVTFKVTSGEFRTGY